MNNTQVGFSYGVESELEQVKQKYKDLKEKYMAITRDLFEISKESPEPLCEFCKHRNDHSGYCGTHGPNNCFKWRGVCEENSKVVTEVKG